MAFNKKTWLARLGQGLNKFSIDGATPVPIINQPDSVTQQGDALSAGNLNDLEQRIADAFDDVEESKADKSTTDALQSQINQQEARLVQHEARLQNLEQKAGDYSIVQYRGTNAVPTGKASYGLVEKIVGKTRAWNQLIENGNFASLSGWSTQSSGCSLSVNNNVITLTRNSTGSGGVNVVRTSPPTFVKGHRYLLSVDGRKASGSESSLRINFYNNNNDSLWLMGTLTSSFTTFFRIATYSYDINYSKLWHYYLVPSVLNVGESVEFRNFHIHDLTTIFPEYTAEQIDALGTSGVIAILSSLGEYNPYDAGSLVSTTVEGVDAVGVNIWDEEWEAGQLNATTGQPESKNNRIRSKNYISVYPSTAYYGFFGSISSVSNAVMFCYDINKQYLGFVSDGLANNSNTTLANTYYIKFYYIGSSYNNDIQICLNSYADKTTYHPFQRSTLMLSSPVTLKSAGDVAEVLNVETGKKTRPIGDINLGTQTWSYSAGIFIANCTSGISGRGANLTCSKYINAGYVSPAEMGNKTIQFITDQIWIRDDSYSSVGSASDPSTFLGQLQNVHAYIPLATPDTDEQVCDPIIDNTVEVQADGTIRTIQSQTPVIDNCLDVGYLAL